uniref:U-scoloptoxin(05)-Er3a n=1 Tax=Ethmostigmus rubripes TaxID=62613 RepID=TX53A_ETHRU|nr:RecName: Full=U-scoloptoxin(05)-Er3a; Short=U-SLPTX(05)-Er3a; Flags: Precursor [Ethmostigmus rubripes]
MRSWFVFVALLAVVFLPSSLDALKCIQCDSQPNRDECKTTLPEARDCPQTVNNYCFKTETFNKNGDLSMLRRYCNVLASTQNGCVDLPGGLGKKCEYSCNTDGCNSVTGLVASRAAYLVTLLPIIFYALSRQ